MNNKHDDVVFHYKKYINLKHRNVNKRRKELIKMTHFIHNHSAFYPHIRSVDPHPHFNLIVTCSQ